MLFALEHGAFAVGLLTGGLLAHELAWGMGHARWFALKLGLVAFLLVPLEGMHAYVSHVLMGRGTGRLVERGFAMEEMIRALEVALMVPALGLITWLSLAHPF
jgi:hypothetical protein